MSKETSTERGCREILDELVKNGLVRNCSKKDLIVAITKLRGVDPRTHKLWIEAMVNLDYLERKNASVYEVKLSKCTDVLKAKIEAETNPYQRRLSP
jgi:hypothetical protein